MHLRLLPGSWALEGRLGLLPGGNETQDSGWSAPQASDRPPPPAADVTVFRPSSFFILVQTGPWLQLQVQLCPSCRCSSGWTPPTAARCAVRLGGCWKQMGSQGGDAAWEAGTLAWDSGWEGEAQGTLPSWQASRWG